MNRELVFRSSGGEIKDFGSVLGGDSSDLGFILGRLGKEKYKEFSNRIYYVDNSLVELMLDLNFGNYMERYLGFRI